MFHLQFWKTLSALASVRCDAQTYVLMRMFGAGRTTADHGDLKQPRRNEDHQQ